MSGTRPARGHGPRSSCRRTRSSRGAPDAALVGRLQAALDARATEKSRVFWQDYLKGAASFRGVPMAEVRAAAHAWWREEELARRPAAAQKRLALRLFAERHTEDRLAGVLILAEILMPGLSADDLPSFARLFERRLIADWNLCDWFCVKVLGPMVATSADPASVARAVSAWRSAGTLWQRRASCVAFVNLARHGDRVVAGLPALIVENAAALVKDPARFAQTGAGWVLRELSVHEPGLATAFAEDHLAGLSREALHYVVGKLPPRERRRLLDLHAAAARANVVVDAGV